MVVMIPLNFYNQCCLYVVKPKPNSNRLRRFEAVKFQIAYNTNLNNFTDRDCDTSKNVSESTTIAPTTVAPTTVAPTTVAPVTVAPVTVAPKTIVENTDAVTTDAATTVAPSPNYRNSRRRKLPAVNTGVHYDYLLIPDGQYSETSSASKFCAKSLENYENVKGTIHFKASK